MFQVTRSTKHIYKWAINFDFEKKLHDIFILVDILALKKLMSYYQRETDRNNQKRNIRQGLTDL